MQFKSGVVFVAFLFTVVLVSSCSQSPTGRSQLKLYSSKQMDSMGVNAFSELKQNTPITGNSIYNAEVNCIATAMTPHIPNSHAANQWEYVVFDDPQINAFALPGGKVGVYAGLIELAQNSAQLAAVIGHEIGHVIAEHSNERLSGDTMIAQGLKLASELLNQNEVSNSDSIMAGLGLGAQMGLKLPFSRTHESEADIIGLELMAKAGFDPRQAIVLWQLMDNQNGGNRQPEFLSTHPSPSTRIENMSQYMPIALKIYEKNPLKAYCG